MGRKIADGVNQDVSASSVSPQPDPGLQLRRYDFPAEPPAISGGAELEIVAERIASSFSRRLIEPASRKNAPRRFYAHHRGTGSGILDRSAALEGLRSNGRCNASR